MDGCMRVLFGGALTNKLLAVIASIAFVGVAVSPVTAQPDSVRWIQVDRALSSLAPQSNLLVGELRGSTCATIHGRNESTPLAIASTFKLYVLGELARQIQVGDAAWNDSIVVTDALRSMPSGDYAFVPAGTAVDVLSLAEAMIAESDNTATDHLINYLGRENVERAFGAFGHSNPQSNVPLLFTRELFSIKMSQSAEWMRQYMSASDDEQLELLESQIDPLVIDPTAGWGLWNGPTAIEGIEWFASAEDLCRVTASLWSIGAQDGLGHVRDILTGNRGGITDTRTWPRAGYKGGLEAGVLNMTYVLERSDGRVFVATASYNQPAGRVDDSAAFSHLFPLFDCLGIVAGAGSCADPT